uniref:Uncharacterized protein n=1 Tax=Ananas comosus var. bracteatus TaxID=296719 RepID=A0A6V7QCL9_ANACO|nr:unnamed protein product [Ananas comosus var. bracteatus]
MCDLHAVRTVSLRFASLVRAWLLPAVLRKVSTASGMLKPCSKCDGNLRRSLVCWPQALAEIYLSFPERFSVKFADRTRVRLGIHPTVPRVSVDLVGRFTLLLDDLHGRYAQRGSDCRLIADGWLLIISALIATARVHFTYTSGLIPRRRVFFSEKWSYIRPVSPAVFSCARVTCQVLQTLSFGTRREHLPALPVLAFRPPPSSPGRRKPPAASLPPLLGHLPHPSRPRACGRVSTASGSEPGLLPPQACLSPSSGHPRRRRSRRRKLRPALVSPDPSQAELRLRALGPHFPCGQAPLSTPATSSNPARASPAVTARRQPPPRSPAAARVLCGPTLEPRHSRAPPLPSEVSTTSPLVCGTESSPPRPPPVAASPPASSNPRGSVRARSPPPRHRLLPAASQHLPRTSPTFCSHHRPERPPPDRRRPSLAPTAPVSSHLWFQHYSFVFRPFFR